MKNEIMQIRRVQLKRWIEEHYQEPYKQAQFVRYLEDKNPGVNISQGEISSLLKEKNFGEKKARRLEALAGMPTGWLDSVSTHPLDEYKAVYDQSSDEVKKMIINFLMAIKVTNIQRHNEDDDKSIKGVKSG